MARKSSRKAIELKGESIEAVSARITSASTADIAAALQAKLGGTPDFFSGEATFLDIADLPADGAVPDWHALRDEFRRYNLIVFGVRNAGETASEKAAQAGLVLLPNEGRDPPRAVAQATKGEDPPPAPAADERTVAEAVEVTEVVAPPTAAQAPSRAAATMVLDKPLRSGQRIYARDADLIVLAMVSAGAEVIADGHIHVYAPLRGRALAGASGNAEARIFTTCFEAELVSVAGVYRTFESGLGKDIERKPVQIKLTDNAGRQNLEVAPLAIA